MIGTGFVFSCLNRILVIGQVISNYSSRANKIKQGMKFKKFGMNNFERKTAIVDLQEQGFGYDMIFVKDHLLYLPGNQLIGSKEMGIKEEKEPVKTQAVKTSFLVYKNQKYTTVQTKNIAFFYIRNESVSMMCFDQQEYALNQSLDQIMHSICSAQFYRVNRKYLINFNAIKEVEHYFLRKLFVKLHLDTPDKLLINKEKTNAFLSWMGDR
jgi:hypothetical protein